MKQYIYIILSILSAACFTAPAAQAADENDCTVQATITETRAGRNWELNVALLNPGTTNLTAFQMDIALPNGVALAEGTLRPGDRTLGHTLMANTLADGTLRIAGFSATNQAIAGNEGVIFSLILNAAEPLSVGSYNVPLTGILLSLRTGIEVPAPNAAATLVASEAARQHTLTFVVDGETYAEYSLCEGDAITLPEQPEKEGYTFTGWDNLPETMPAENVTVNAVFTVNKYKVFYYLDRELYATQDVAYGATITPPEVKSNEAYVFQGWQDVPATMPAHDINIYGAMKATSIAAVRGEGSSSQREVYTLSGIRLSSSGPLPRGVYIVDGKRVLVK